MKETEVLVVLRNTLGILSSIAKSADLHALVFLIGMAELDAAQAEANAKREAFARR